MNAKLPPSPELKKINRAQKTYPKISVYMPQETFDLVHDYCYENDYKVSEFGLLAIQKELKYLSTLAPENVESLTESEAKNRFSQLLKELEQNKNKS